MLASMNPSGSVMTGVYKFPEDIDEFTDSYWYWYIFSSCKGSMYAHIANSSLVYSFVVTNNLEAKTYLFNYSFRGTAGSSLVIILQMCVFGEINSYYCNYSLYKFINNFVVPQTRFIYNNVYCSNSSLDIVDTNCCKLYLLVVAPLEILLLLKRPVHQLSIIILLVLMMLSWWRLLWKLWGGGGSVSSSTSRGFNIGRFILFCYFVGTNTQLIFFFRHFEIDYQKKKFNCYDNFMHQAAVCQYLKIDNSLVLFHHINIKLMFPLRRYYGLHKH